MSLIKRTVVHKPELPKVSSSEMTNELYLLSGYCEQLTTLNLHKYFTTDVFDLELF
jgi:hypothetical protein